MRGKSLLCGLLAAGLAVVAGCHHEKYKVKVKHAEDYVVPPNEPRFDEPPEEEWKRSRIKKKDAPGGGMQGGMSPSSPAMMGGGYR